MAISLKQQPSEETWRISIANSDCARWGGWMRNDSGDEESVQTAHRREGAAEKREGAAEKRDQIADDSNT